MMGYWDYYPRYVRVSEKKARAAAKLAQLRKRNPDIRPILIQGRAIAQTWWGRSWNVNLERYADYSNRIGRGRSYVRNHMVLDLQISPGEVTALVQGTASRPYSVSVKIKGIGKDIWKGIKAACQGQLESLPELLEGKFPRALGEIFTAQGQGLFPSPKEIAFACSCPDWATMCKHVAATLYGIGARLDDDPMLFFKLRKADVHDLISEAVEDRKEKLLKKAVKKSARVIDDADLAGMFGIELEEAWEARPTKALRPSRKTARKKALRKKPPVVAGNKAVQGKKTAKASRKPPLKKEKNLSILETVARVIRRSRKGVNMATLVKKTGLEERKIYNAISRLKKQGQISSPERGAYRKA